MWEFFSTEKQTAWINAILIGETMSVKFRHWLTNARSSRKRKALDLPFPLHGYGFLHFQHIAHADGEKQQKKGEEEAKAKFS